MTSGKAEARIHGVVRRLLWLILVASGMMLIPASPAHASNDPLWSSQWALTQIGAPQSWSRSTGTGVLIGVVDTGADLNHEDLAGRVVAATSCVGSKGDPAACTGTGQDDHGHGTHVSAIAAAATGNGRGIAGVAPDARLLVAKALVSDGVATPSGAIADVNAGIKWVVDRGARVVNLSISGDKSHAVPSLRLLSEGISYAWSRGAVPVLAAGNDLQAGEDAPEYGGLTAVVIGANDRNGALASYSSRLDTARWGLVAPGGAGGDPARGESYAGANIVSAWWNGGRRNEYAATSGTSMAAAHVSGALALLMAQGLAPEAAVRRVLVTADRSIPCGAGCHGRLDVARATGAPASVAMQRGGAGPAPRTADSASVVVKTKSRRVAPERDAALPVSEAQPTAGNQVVLGDPVASAPVPTPTDALPGQPLSPSEGSFSVPVLIVLLAMAAVVADQLLTRRRRYIGREPP